MRMRTRLEYIYRRLDGKKELDKSEPTDEFTACQNHLKEVIISARSKIQDKTKIEKKGGNAIELRRIKNEMADAMADVEETLAKLKSILQSIVESPKVASKVKEERTAIVEKFEDLIKNLTIASHSGQTEVFDPSKPKKVEKLDELKRYKNLNNPNETRNDIFGEENPDDDRVINEWKQADEKMDQKLNDVILILDEIKLMNENLGRDIDVRNAVIDDANKDAAKTNKELATQNKNLANVLRKIRSPGKVCLDFCLVILLLGLIAVIIMMAINGKG